jgi:hypothetical protein
VARAGWAAANGLGFVSKLAHCYGRPRDASRRMVTELTAAGAAPASQFGEGSKEEWHCDIPSFKAPLSDRRQRAVILYWGGRAGRAGVNSLICDCKRDGCNIRNKRQDKLHAAACEEGHGKRTQPSHGIGRVACTNGACRLRGVMDRWVNKSGERSEGESESESCAGLCFGWKGVTSHGCLCVGVCVTCGRKASDVPPPPST